jgi:uncharacterized protein HemX
MRALDLFGSLLIYGAVAYGIYIYIKHNQRRRAERRRELNELHGQHMEELEKESDVFRQQLDAYEQQKPEIDRKIADLETKQAQRKKDN